MHRRVMPDRRLKARVCCVIAALAAPLVVAAQHVHPEPPAARLPRQAGVVSFENSGAARAQEDFLYGLAQLHNFQYEVAAAAFRRAQRADPDFAMAYWGEAMTHEHPIWAQQDPDAARAVLRRLAATPEARRAKAPTEREKAYLDAVEILYGDGSEYDRDRRYALAMEQLHAAYPGDVDATCFFALSLLGTAHAGRDIAIYMRSAALMEEAFERYPQHPGAAHYLIHSVDDAAHAPLGLRAANVYAKIAPDSSHAQHMTSHIYLALGMWQETVAANQAAIAVAARNLRELGQDRKPPSCGHVPIWLAYGYLQQGRVGAARELVEACGAEAQAQPVVGSGRDLVIAEGSSAGVFHEMRARHLIDSGEWDAVSLQQDRETGQLPVLARFSKDFAEAYYEVRFAKGDVERGAAAVGRAGQSATRLLQAIDEAGVPAGHPQRLVPAIEMEQLQGLLLLRRGATERAVELLAKAAAAERQLPADFGPPSLHKPANELLGEVLLDLGRASAARAAFDAAQLLAPGRTQSLAGLARSAEALGEAQLKQSVEARLKQIRASAATGRE